MSGVSTLVETIVTSITVPETPEAVTKSPALNGLNISNIIPPAKFCTVPDNAIPIAIPPAVSRAANEVVSTPSVPMVASTRSTVSVILTRDEINVAKVRSVCLRSKTRTNNLFTRLMSHAPIR